MVQANSDAQTFVHPITSTTAGTYVMNVNDLSPSPTTPPAPSDLPLSTQQSLILERILKGENFFFTGSAGTGKSVLLRAIIKALRERASKICAERLQGEEARVKAYLAGDIPPDELTESTERGLLLGVTASTGMAAV